MKGPIVFFVAEKKERLRDAAQKFGASEKADMFYLPMKKEKISLQKKVILRDDSGEATVLDAKSLAEKHGVKNEVTSSSVKGFALFVQSTSPNRNLEKGQEACFLDDGAKKPNETAKKRGRSSGNEDAMRSFFEEVFDMFDKKGVSYVDKFGGQLPENAPTLFRILKARMKDVGDDGALPFLGMRPILHTQVVDVDEEEEDEKEDGNYLNRGDDLKPENLGKSKYGGVPHLPDELSHYSRRNDFVAQFDLSFISQFDFLGLLPCQGFMWFWFSLEYCEENPCVVRYWNGPRDQLKPRERSATKALPVYFMVGMTDEGLFGNPKPLGFPLFSSDELIDNPGGESWTSGPHPAFKASITLLAIRNYRESVFSKMPRDVVRIIAKMVFDSQDERVWESDTTRFREVANENLWPFMSLGLDDCCGYAHSCFYASPVIEFDKAKKGLWHEAFSWGNTD